MRLRQHRIGIERQEGDAMARRLTHEESRAIKRAMRATPRISQRMHDGWLGDDGRFLIKAGKPPFGQLLEATKSDIGQWSVEIIDMWESDVSEADLQSSAARKNNQQSDRPGRRTATPKWLRHSWLAVICSGALSLLARPTNESRPSKQ
jgi:hypothetical protein